MTSQYKPSPRSQSFESRLRTPRSSRSDRQLELSSTQLSFSYHCSALLRQRYRRQTFRERRLVLAARH